VDGARERLTALGRELARVHDWLREDLGRLREGRERDAGPWAVRCLAFCDAVTRHHTAEDGVAFPALVGRFPELAPVVEKLVEDHRLLAGILSRVAEIAAAPEAERGELDGLAAVLDSHFAFEERRVAAAFDALPTDPAAALGVLPPDR
jgi:Hemerythrin HHE cation binding domain